MQPPTPLFLIALIATVVVPLVLAIVLGLIYPAVEKETFDDLQFFSGCPPATAFYDGSYDKYLCTGDNNLDLSDHAILPTLDELIDDASNYQMPLHTWNVTIGPVQASSQFVAMNIRPDIAGDVETSEGVLVVIAEAGTVPEGVTASSDNAQFTYLSMFNKKLDFACADGTCEERNLFALATEGRFEFLRVTVGLYSDADGAPNFLSYESYGTDESDGESTHPEPSVGPLGLGSTFTVSVTYGNGSISYTLEIVRFVFLVILSVAAALHGVLTARRAKTVSAAESHHVRAGVLMVWGSVLMVSPLSNLLAAVSGSLSRTAGDRINALLSVVGESVALYACFMLTCLDASALIHARSAKNAQKLAHAGKGVGFLFAVFHFVTRVASSPLITTFLANAGLQLPELAFSETFGVIASILLAVAIILAVVVLAISRVNVGPSAGELDITESRSLSEIPSNKRLIDTGADSGAVPSHMFKRAYVLLSVVPLLAMCYILSAVIAVTSWRFTDALQSVCGFLASFGAPFALGAFVLADALAPR